MSEENEHIVESYYDELSAQQRLFVDCYINPNKANFNAGKAATMAGYSEKTAYAQGSRMLKNVNISEAIKERMRGSIMDADQALMRLSLIASGTVTPFMNAVAGGRVFVDLSTEEARDNYNLVKKIKQTRHVTERDGVQKEEIKTEFELHDAKDALVQILKIHGRFRDNKQYNMNIDLTTLSDEQLERLANGEPIERVLKLSG